jgi:hypothetical protein
MTMVVGGVCQLLRTLCSQLKEIHKAFFQQYDVRKEAPLACDSQSST